MEESPKKKFSGYLLLIPIAIIATCNIVLNTQKENEDKAVIKKPAVGDYYVFYRQGGSLELAFKVKELRQDKVVFYIPNYELGTIGNDREKLGSYISRMEQEKKLYGDNTIEIAKTTLDSMTNTAIEKRKYLIAAGLTVSFVDSYKGHSRQP